MLKDLINYDREILVALNLGWASPELDQLMTAISEQRLWHILAAGLILIAWRRRQWELLKLYFFGLCVVGIADSSASQILKPLFDRIRPCKELSFIRPVAGCAGMLGFPSNHAVNAMTIAMLGMLNGPRWLGVMLFMSALLVGWSRVFLGAHYPTDVLAGFVYGGLVAIVAQAIRLRLLTRVLGNNNT